MRHHTKYKLYTILNTSAFVCMMIFTLGQALTYTLSEIKRFPGPVLERQDIAPLLEKEELTKEEENLIFQQTGVSSLGIERLKEKYGNASKLLKFQDDFYGERKMWTEYEDPWCSRQNLVEPVNLVPMKKGDILISLGSQFLGFLIGHAALVVDPALNRMIDISGYGYPSEICTISYYNYRPCFAVLSPLVSDDVKEEVVKFAVDHLQGIEYDITVGVFQDKNKIDKSQCAHLVWYAYQQFGIDLDYNGGRIVTPKELALSPLTEVVQVFGIDTSLFRE